MFKLTVTKSQEEILWISANCVDYSFCIPQFKGKPCYYKIYVSAKWHVWKKGCLGLERDFLMDMYVINILLPKPQNGNFTSCTECNLDSA